MSYTLSPIFPIMGAIFGVFLGQVILRSCVKQEDENGPAIEIVIKDTGVIEGNAMYWKNDTLWDDKNYTQFLKVYPKKLLDINMNK